MPRSFLNRCALALLVWLAAGSTGYPHFVWITVMHDGGKALASVRFSEDAAAGEATLIDRVRQTQVKHRAATGTEQKLKLERRVRGDEGELVAPLPAGSDYTLSATCTYGLFSRGATPFLLEYYARHLSAVPASAPAKHVASGHPLQLDVHCDGERLVAVVHWKDKPAAKLEVVAYDKEGETHKFTTDDAGKAMLSGQAAQWRSLRAMFAEPDRTGEHDGKKYTGVRHYATLTWSESSTAAK